MFSVSMAPGEDNLGKCKGLGKVQPCIARTAKQDAFILLCRLVQSATLLSPFPNICFLHILDISRSFVASIYSCYRSTTWKSNNTRATGEAASRIHSLPPTILPEMRCTSHFESPAGTRKSFGLTQNHFYAFITHLALICVEVITGLH